MTFTLRDDGTLDTVLTCDECGAELRYNDSHSGDSCECQDAVIEWAMADAEETHECLNAETTWPKSLQEHEREFNEANS